MTWLLVIAIPSDEMRIPVPAAAPPPSSEVLRFGCGWRSDYGPGEES